MLESVQLSQAEDRCGWQLLSRFWSLTEMAEMMIRLRVFIETLEPRDHGDEEHEALHCKEPYNGQRD